MSQGIRLFNAHYDTDTRTPFPFISFSSFFGFMLSLFAVLFLLSFARTFCCAKKSKQLMLCIKSYPYKTANVSALHMDHRPSSIQMPTQNTPRYTLSRLAALSTRYYIICFYERDSNVPDAFSIAT